MCVLAVLVLEVLAQMMSSKQELTAVSLLKGQFFLRLILGIALYYNRSANEEMYSHSDGNSVQHGSRSHSRFMQFSRIQYSMVRLT